jgi:glycosyltransferase involved in cell wall biosynthesis
MNGERHGEAMPKITILMAVRDTPPEMLRQAIESIRGQTLREFEFLILDDGSKRPETLAELEWQAAADSRIRLEHGPPRGLTATLNGGLALATGEWIARQDADDWSEPDRLERQATYLDAHPQIILCGSNAHTHQHDGRPLWATRLPESAAAIREALWKGNPFVHGSMLFRTGIARELGGYREEFPCAQDYDFFWRLTDAGGGANLPEPLYHYRYSAGL